MSGCRYGWKRVGLIYDKREIDSGGNGGWAFKEDIMGCGDCDVFIGGWIGAFVAYAGKVNSINLAIRWRGG